MVVIPKFILKRLYVQGSLRKVPEGVAFDIKNSVGPGILTRINRIRLNDIEYKAQQILFKLEDRLLQAVEISEDNPVIVFLNQKITCILQEASLACGNHTITVDLHSREAGQVVLTVQDSPGAAGSLA
jgi:hypothetical protein